MSEKKMLRRFDLRLDSVERAALRATARSKGISATMFLRQLIRATCGLPSLVGGLVVSVNGSQDDIGEDVARTNGQGVGHGRDR